MSTIISLQDVVRRSLPPNPWEEGENIPWDEPGFSSRMLREHLSQEHALASRRLPDIDEQIAWLLDSVLEHQPGRVLDLACGPGLYLNGLCRKGCTGVGIDFGPASIEHARAVASREALDCTFEHRDLRLTSFGSGYDLALLIYGQINVFRREEARKVLGGAFAALKPGGRLVLEPQTVESIRGTGGPVSAWSTVENGLFSARPHVQLHEVFWDEASRTRTERWHIIDAETASVERHAMSCIAWDANEFETMLREIGFASVEMLPGLTGATNSSNRSLFVIVARR